VVGRDEALATVAGLLADPGVGGVLLLGPAGVGKTAVATRLTTDAVGRGDVVVRLVATPATSLVPLGALAGLGDLGPASSATADRAAVRAAAERALDGIRGAQTTRALLVVDDAPLLDPGSAELIADLVRRGLVVLLATARDGMARPPELDGLLVDGTLVAHPLAPLSATALRAAVETALDGPLHHATAEALFAASQGLPLHARELVQANLAAGRLVDSTDGWTFVGRPIAPPRLLDLVASRFRSLTDEARQVFEILAFAQPMPLDAAIALAGVDLLASLEGAGLVTTSDEPTGPVVCLGHPLYDEVVRADLAPLQRRQAAQRAAEALDALPHHQYPDLPLRAACLRLDHDLPLQSPDAVAAARRALALVDPELAERLVRRAEDGFEASFVLGTSLIAQGRHNEADDALRDAFVAASDDGERARVISRRGNNLGTGAGRFDDAITVLEAGLATIDDPRWKSFVAADLAYARLWTGAVDPDPLPAEDEPRPAAVRANECLVGAVVAVMRGELAKAEAFVGEGLPLAHALRDDVPTARELLTLSRFLTLAFAGERTAAEQVVDAELDRAAGQSAAAAGSWIAVRSMQHLYDGNAPAAIAMALDAEARLAAVDISGLRPVVQAIRATALAQLGDVPGSMAANAAIDETWRTEAKVRIQLAVADGWREVMAGRPRPAAATFAAAGELGLELNHVAFGAFAAHDAARLGHPRPALPVLRAAAARLEGSLVRALLAHAELLDAGDAPALLALAPQLPALGFTLSGAEAASQAARLYEQQGASSDARRAEFMAATLARPLDGVRSPTLGRPRGLTPREQQVADLAAHGRRSRDIGEALGISTRTVDNHLSAIYQKLGITTRAELARTIAS
jgi:DNA-binding CsgD family transcriptional regulator